MLDVHPPLYYALVHTICSFFPNRYSKWFAGSINIAFAIWTLFLMRKMTRKVSGKETAEFLVSCCFIFSAGVLSATTFLRMYVMAMFFVTAIAYLMWKGIEERNFKFYCEIAAVSLAGSLTHYYFIIYLFLACVIFGIYLLLKKKWKELGLFCLSVGMAEVAAVLVFPTALTHSLGGGYRGQETLTNLFHTTASDWVRRVKTCFSVVDSQLFGGCFFIVMGIAVALFLAAMVMKKSKRKTRFSTERVFQWLILWVPVISYFLIISHVTVYLTDRYFHPIYPLLIVLTVNTLCIALGKLFPERMVFVLASLLFALTTIKDFKENWFYLYRSTSGFLEVAKNYSNLDCIYVIHMPYEINPSFYEISNYNSVTFLSQIDPEVLGTLDLDVSNGLILSMGAECNFEEIYGLLRERWQTLENYEFLGGHSFSVTYRIY